MGSSGTGIREPGHSEAPGGFRRFGNALEDEKQWGTVPSLKVTCGDVELRVALGKAALLDAPRDVDGEVLLEDVMILAPVFGEGLASNLVEKFVRNEGKLMEARDHLIRVGGAKLLRS